MAPLADRLETESDLCMIDRDEGPGEKLCEIALAPADRIVVAP
ncbi:hypothetical protein [uncultured Phenylobacterium sp.]|nr:hypothetical protein [uncultured Phenylobacterium sp.]